MLEVIREKETNRRVLAIARKRPDILDQSPPQLEIYCVVIRIGVLLYKGPGTLASISPVSEYWKNWPSVIVLDFVKYV